MYPPSPPDSFGVPSPIEFAATLNSIKKEQSQQQNYPPSPPDSIVDSNGAPSPLGYQYDINAKLSDKIGFTENIDSFFQNSTSPASSSSLSLSSNSLDSMLAFSDSVANLDTIFAIPQQQTAVSIETTKKDQLLREYLQDSSFQKKYKPTLDSIFIDDWDVRDDIEPVISLALEHARKDVEQTCISLNISSGNILCKFHF